MIVYLDEMNKIWGVLFVLSVIGVSCEGAREDHNNYSPDSDEIITIKKEEDDFGEEIIYEDLDYDEDDLLDFAEIDPEFPGGEAEMNKFIQENILYPQEAIEKGEQGIVYVQFVVRKNGDINDVEIVRGVSESLDKEAARVIKKMPRWRPGKQNDEYVNVRFTIPIHFTLG